MAEVQKTKTGICSIHTKFWCLYPSDSCIYLSTVWGEARDNEQVYIVALMRDSRIFLLETYFTKAIVLFSLMSSF